MKSPDIAALASWHPLRGHACPVTGRAPILDPAWTVRKPDYHLDTGILERGVVVSLPIGHTVLADTGRFFEIMGQIRQHRAIDRDAFVLVEDYTGHSGSDTEGRLQYIKRMVEEVKPLGVVFITRSTTWRLSIRLGVALGRFALPVQLAANYPKALGMASKLLGRPLDGEEDPQTVWTNARVRLAVSVLPGAIVQAVWEGRPTLEELPALVRQYDRAVSRALAENQGRYLALHDVRAFTEASFREVHALEKGLLQARPGRVAERTVVVGGGAFGRLVAGLAGVIAERTVESAPDLESGLRLLRGASRAAETVTGEGRDPLIAKTLSMLGSLRWDEPEGKPSGEPSLPEAERDLGLAIATLKHEVAIALAERERELEDLSAARNGARKLGLELEAALRHSSRRREDFERLTRENFALESGIAQAQREVLSVLADFIDERCGRPKNRTRDLASLVHRLALGIGASPEDSDRFDRACLLHHVGFLGIPDVLARETSDPDSVAHHGALGHEVLSRLVGMECAADLALTHHARWDGLGSPSDLAGNDIPLVSRFFALAERVHAGATGAHLREEAGTFLDPELVRMCLENELIE
jgi:HD-GYP domain-containing protein (c-di-GMP phosphodiesterase class II)